MVGKANELKARKNNKAIAAKKNFRDISLHLISMMPSC
jgi:hypothetical protein